MALRLVALPALPKLAVYATLTSTVLLLPPPTQVWATIAAVLMGPVLGVAPVEWVKTGVRYLPLALLPTLAWLVQVSFARSLTDWPSALFASVRFFNLLLFSDLFTRLTSARQVRDLLSFWPPLAVATGLFLSYLPWLREEIPVLGEAARLRGKLAFFTRITLPTRYLLNLIVRGMERSRDGAEALLLRGPGIGPGIDSGGRKRR